MTKRKKILTAAFALAAVAALAVLLFYRPGGATGSSPAGERARAPQPPRRMGSADQPVAGAPRPGPQVALDDDPPGPLLLEGQVLDGSEQPVGGATVRLSSVPPRTATSDADGSFSFDKLIPRAYSLTARRGDQVGGPVQHSLRASSEPVIIRLATGAALDVTVVAAATGAPIAGATVRLGDDQALTATTDSSGVGHLRGVAGGYEWVVARATGFAAGRSMVQVPAVPGAVAAVRLELRRGAPVSGVVVDDRGAPIAGARVWESDTADPFGDTNEEDRVTTDEKGRFTLAAVAAGTHRFHASHPEHPTATSEPRAVDGASPTEGVRIQLARGARLAGHVVDRSDAPVAWASVTVGPRRNSRGGEMVPRRTTTDERGAFQLRGLPRAALLALAASEESTSATAEVDLTAVADRRDLLLRLDVSGRIEGVVVDSAGQPVAEAEVVAHPDFLSGAVPEDVGVRGWSVEATDGGGRFAFRGLPDGKYRVDASRGGARGGDQPGRHSATAATGDTGVRLVVESPGVVRGRVQLPDGSSPPLFTVAIGYAPPLPVSSRTGAFELPAVAPGKHDLTVRGPDFSPTIVRDVVVAEGQVRDVGVVKVAKGRTVSGRVLDAGGAPVAGATVALGMNLIGDGRSLVSSVASSFGDQLAMRRTTSDADGRYAVSGIDPAKAMVIAAEHETAGRSAAASIPQGSESLTIDLVLAGVGSIAGVVAANGKPTAAQVVATPPGAPGQSIVVSAGADGTYQIERLAAGDYKVTAALGSGTGAVTRSKSARVEVGKRAKVDIDIPLGDITLTISVKPRGAGKIDSSQVFLFAGKVSPTNAREVNEAFTSASGDGGAKAAMPSTGDTHFTDVSPGVYSVCVLPLAGDLSDPQVQQRIMAALDKLKVYCSPYTVTAAPVQQSYTAVVPPMEPLE